MLHHHGHSSAAHRCRYVWVASECFVVRISVMSQRVRGSDWALSQEGSPSRTFLDVRPALRRDHVCHHGLSASFEIQVS